MAAINGADPNGLLTTYPKWEPILKVVLYVSSWGDCRCFSMFFVRKNIDSTLQSEWWEMFLFDVFFFHVENVQIILSYPKRNLTLPETNGWNLQSSQFEKEKHASSAFILRCKSRQSSGSVFSKSGMTRLQKSIQQPTAVGWISDFFQSSVTLLTKTRPMCGSRTNQSNPWYFNKHQKPQVWREVVKSPCCSSPRWFHPDQTTPGDEARKRKLVF